MDKEDEFAEKAKKARLRYHQPAPAPPAPILPHFNTHFNHEYHNASSNTSTSTTSHPSNRAATSQNPHHRSSVPSHGQHQYQHLPSHHVHTLNVPPVVQSASTSPHESHMHLVPSHLHQQPRLPHFSDMQWERSVAPSHALVSGSTSSAQVHSTLMSTRTYDQTPASTTCTSYLAPPLANHLGSHSTVNSAASPPMPMYTSQAAPAESPVPSAQFANAGPPGVHYGSYYTPAPVHQPSSVYPSNWTQGPMRGRKW
jgi:hypothetical protein